MLASMKNNENENEQLNIQKTAISALKSALVHFMQTGDE